MKWEGNVFSRVCLCQSVHGGPHVTTTHMVQGPLITQGTPDMFKLRPHHTGTPHHAPNPHQMVGRLP